MALSWSQGIRDFVNNFGSYQRALQGGVIGLYTGSPPANADAAVTDTLLCTVSLASGVVTNEVVAFATLTFSGGSGSIDSITVGGNEILGASIPYTTDLATTVALAADQINRYLPKKGQSFRASSSSAVLTISCLPGTGTSGNGLPTTASATTLTVSTSGFGTAGTGVNGTNGLTYDVSVAGVMGKKGVWSGTNRVSGVAGYFRITGAAVDNGNAGTTAIRVQGLCGISSGDYPMTTTALTAGQTHTIDTFFLTLPSA